MSYKGAVGMANCNGYTQTHMSEKCSSNVIIVVVLPCSLPVWQVVRNGDTICTACRTTLPCEKHFLTFGGYNSRASQLYTKLALTRTLFLLIFKAAILSKVSIEEQFVCI